MIVKCDKASCPCHSQEPQQEGWIEEKVREFKNHFVEANGTMLRRFEQPTQFMVDWYKAALTEAYNLGKKEGLELVDEAKDEARKYGYEAGTVHGIRSEREKILELVPEQMSISGGLFPLREHIRDIITNPQNRE